MSGAVRNREQCLKSGCGAAHLFDVRHELLCVNAGHHIGVVEEIEQLIIDVAVVDVDRDGANFEAGPHGLDKFVAVVEVEPDLIARADSVCEEMVGDLVGTRLEGTEGRSGFAADLERFVREPDRQRVQRGQQD